MFRKWHLLILVVVTLSLILVPACGGGDDEVSPTSVETSTPTSTISATTPTVQPTSDGPVKIGAVNSWSGPAAVSGITFADPCIKLVEKQVKDSGGILGGREVKVVRYDNRASVAEAIAGCTKLFTDDEVSALVFGGVSAAEYEAVSDFADENHILYVAQGGLADVAQRKFTVNGGVFSLVYLEQSVTVPLKIVNPDSVALLGQDSADIRDRNEYRREQFEAAGVKVVYEDYVSLGTPDMSSYLTKIKYADPDVLIIDTGVSEIYITAAVQMMELGGWGDIKVFAGPAVDMAKSKSGAQGWYAQVLWFPQDQYPASVKFLNEYKALNGSEPRASNMYYYYELWVAIEAIKLAGTDSDRVAIAEAARSGNLVLDTPMGVVQFNTEGYSDLAYKIGQIQDKNIVPVIIPE